MKYLINEIIQFNPFDHSLLSKDVAPDMLTLNRLTSELLLLFIVNNGIPLTRDKILSELWEKRGLNASSNNLNNYVSQLRKALANCGCESVITTIPRHGFLFQADILLLKEIEANDKALPVCEKSDDSPAENSPPLRDIILYAANKRLFLTLTLGGIIFCAILYFLPALYDHYRLASVRTELFRTEQCRFWLIDDITRRMEPTKIISRINSIIEKENIACNLKANIYFSADKLQEAKGDVVINELLSYCPYDSKAPCENYTYSRNEGKHE